MALLLPLLVVSAAGLRAPEPSSCGGPLKVEPGRPRFHFTPARNWMNDPNGLVFYKGEYHLFFQHNPYGVNWGNMTWGHAVSSDLLHWRQLDPALWPDEQGDIWSGSAVVDWGNASGLQRKAGEPPLVAFYTNNPMKRAPFYQRLAFSTDRGRTWQRLRKPIIASQDAAPAARDPKVIWHAPSRQWLLALYARGSRDGHFYLFASDDLRQWRKLQELRLEGSGGECPDIFELPLEGGAAGAARFVFLTASGAYVVGQFNGSAFQPEGPVRYLEYGDAYGAQTFSDEPRGRRVQLAWMGASKACSRGAVWSQEPFTGQMTLPMELQLVKRRGEAPRLRRRPAEELRSLRCAPALLHLAAVELRPGDGRSAAAGAGGGGLEARLRARPLAPGGGLRLRLRLLGQELEVRAAGAAEKRRFERFEAGAYRYAEELAVPAWAAVADGRRLPLDLDEQGAVELAIFLDRHSLEVFDTSGGASMATCLALPRDEGKWSHSVSVVADDSSAVVESLEVFQLQPSVEASA